MPHVSITRLRLRAWRFLPAFAWHTWRSSRQTRRAEGYLDGALLSDRARTFWTATLWRDEAAMRGYMLDGAHARAMPNLREWCDEASVVGWSSPLAELPDWRAADIRMRTEGRPSRLRRPNPEWDMATYAAPDPSRHVPLGGPAGRDRPG